MRLECWHITGEGFHFGRHGLGQEETNVAWSSDSLFAALLTSLASSYGGKAVENFIAPFIDGNPPFVISSTFPYAGDVRFFPVPMGSIEKETIESPVRAKDLKRILYVSEGIFSQLIQGALLAELYRDSLKLQSQCLLVSPSDIESLPKDLRQEGSAIWSVEKRPRVALDRASRRSNLFFTGRVTYLQDCGLWFGIYWTQEDKALNHRIAGLLAELGDAGLGGERSSGFGKCQIVNAGDIELHDGKGRPWVALSRYLPHPDEISALMYHGAAYRLERVVGWLDSPIKRGQKRRPVNLLAEGSTFGPLERAVPGLMVDARPKYPNDPDPLGHAAYRSGFALAVGLEGG